MVSHISRIVATAGDGRTHIRWTYSFQLNRHRFPGMLGSLGDYLFRISFLDRPYAAMMRGVLVSTKADSERPADGHVAQSDPRL
jgi:hypothetical protein